MIRYIILERHIRLKDIGLEESRLKLESYEKQVRNDDGLKVDGGSEEKWEGNYWKIVEEVELVENEVREESQVMTKMLV